MVSVAKMSIGVSASIRDRNGLLMKQRFDPIIYKGDRLPCTRDRTYKTTKPLQKAINIKVYGGENPKVEDNLELGNFLVEDIPENDTGKEKINISFHINEDLILYIFIKVQSTGKEEVRTIDTRNVQGDLETFNSIYKDNI